MAHDKVYVRIAEDDDFGTASIEQRPFTEAYISKNALMEWAKVHKRVIETRGDERDAYLQGEYSVLNSLIDQLNTM